MKLKKLIFALLLIPAFSANVRAYSDKQLIKAYDFREEHYPADKVEGHFFNLVEFADFEFIAVTDYYKNFLDDVTKTDSNEYFELNGTEIPDIYAYIAYRGEEPSEGTYHNYKAQRDMPFEPIPPLIGTMDLFPELEGVSQPLPRYRIGNGNHCLVGNNVPETGIGMFVEDEDGTDRLGAAPSYVGGSGHSVWLTQEFPEIYILHYSIQHPAEEYYEVYNADFVKTGGGNAYGEGQPVLPGNTRPEYAKTKTTDLMSKINLKFAAFAAVTAAVIALWMEKRKKA